MNELAATFSGAHLSGVIRPKRDQVLAAIHRVESSSPPGVPFFYGTDYDTHPLGSRVRAHFEKLAIAAASVWQTSNTVTSLVICSTFWTLLPRWQRTSDAPSDFALQCAATNMPSPALSIYLRSSIFRTIFFFPSAIKLFNFTRRALPSSPSTMRPSSATTETPPTSRLVIFKATFVSPHREVVPRPPTPGTARRTNNDPH